LKKTTEKSVKDTLIRVVKFYEKNDYALSITIALAIASVLLIYSYIAFMKPNGFISFSILDQQKEAKNYPELLIIGENNTCHLWVVIENHMEKSISCKVLLKITKSPILSMPLPIEGNISYDVVISNGEKWEEPIEFVINETGDFHLVFELWIYDEKTGEFEFSDNFSVLNIKVIEA